jgi:hypothetical protein
LSAKASFTEEGKMRQTAWIVTTGAMAVMAASIAQAQEAQPLTACAGAVGTYLTSNPGSEPSRSLLSLTSDGVVLFADSGQGGGTGFAPFSGGHGAWRCLGSGGDGLRVSVIILDFTLATADWPNQKIGRLDIEATVAPAKGAMSGTMKLLITDALADDPYVAAELVPDAGGSFTAIRVTAP